MRSSGLFLQTTKTYPPKPQMTLCTTPGSRHTYRAVLLMSGKSKHLDPIYTMVLTCNLYLNMLTGWRKLYVYAHRTHTPSLHPLPAVWSTPSHLAKKLKMNSYCWQACYIHPHHLHTGTQTQCHQNRMSNACVHVCDLFSQCSAVVFASLHAYEYCTVCTCACVINNGLELQWQVIRVIYLSGNQSTVYWSAL